MNLSKMTEMLSILQALQAMDNAKAQAAALKMRGRADLMNARSNQDALFAEFNQGTPGFLPEYFKQRGYSVPEMTPEMRLMGAGITDPAMIEAFKKIQGGLPQ